MRKETCVLNFVSLFAHAVHLATNLAPSPTLISRCGTTEAKNLHQRYFRSSARSGQPRLTVRYYLVKCNYLQCFLYCTSNCDSRDSVAFGNTVNAVL